MKTKNHIKRSSKKMKMKKNILQINLVLVCAQCFCSIKSTYRNIDENRLFILVIHNYLYEVYVLKSIHKNFDVKSNFYC